MLPLEAIAKFRDDIEKSMDMGLGMLNYDKLVKLVESGNLNVFSSDDGVIVYEQKTIHGKPLFNTVLCGGELGAVEFLQKKLEEAAAAAGAVGVMIIGRKGWGKIFDGYSAKATVYFKEFGQ